MEQPNPTMSKDKGFDSSDGHMNQSLKHHMLLAMPGLKDPYFVRAVIYVFQHNIQGAFGLIINKPVAMTEAQLLAHLAVPYRAPPTAAKLLFGGPVLRDRGFVLHADQQAWTSSLHNNDWSVTTSKDILTAISRGQGPKQRLICLGYAGWSAGQLEQEMQASSWLALPADAQTVFVTPTQDRFNHALSQAGIDPALFAQQRPMQ